MSGTNIRSPLNYAFTHSFGTITTKAILLLTDGNVEDK